MTQLLKKQLKFLIILALIIVVYIIAKPVFIHVVYWIVGVALVITWIFGLIQSIHGKDPLEYWVEDDNNNKYN